MPKRKSPASSQSSSPQHLERSGEWSGVRTGDAVEVSGMRTRSSTWSFLAHVRNVRTGEEWVEVVGGKGGSRAVRSFRPEQIYPPAPRAARRGDGSSASLAVAPRLPL